MVSLKKKDIKIQWDNQFKKSKKIIKTLRN